MKIPRILLGIVLLSFVIFSFINVTKSSERSFLNKKEKDFRAIEFNVYEFQNEEHLEEFLHYDSIVWTPFIMKNRAFFSKRIAQPVEYPNRLAMFIEWNSYEVWKETTDEMNAQQEKIFEEYFKHDYKTIQSENYKLLEFDNYK
ncbi:hypothetical protein [Aureivirga sp. CE67]|uniref:hypothetical protein n=1 Tax=Aureivirga sp. CE67 TaxID=1788983 RepID=UPI0018C93477|nr:hypothetical protein [Aureivirga sp. CE67]